MDELLKNLCILWASAAWERAEHWLRVFRIGFGHLALHLSDHFIDSTASTDSMSV